MRQRTADIATLLSALAGALLALAAVACASPAPTAVSGEAHDADCSALDEPDCSPYPFDIMAIYALYQSVD